MPDYALKALWGIVIALFITACWGIATAQPIDNTTADDSVVMLAASTDTQETPAAGEQLSGFEDTDNMHPIPEPTTLGLLGIGACFFLFRMSRRRKVSPARSR